MSGGARAAPEVGWPDYEPELHWAVGLAAAIWQLIALTQVLMSLHGYRYPALSVGVWLGLLGAAAWLLPRTRRRTLTATEAAVAVAVTVAAVGLVGWDHLPDAAGAIDWSVVGAGWLLALIAVSRPLWVAACGAVLVYLTHTFFLLGALGFSPLSLTQLVGSAYPLVGVIVVVGGLRPTLRAYATTAARRAALTSRAASEQAAAQAVRQDRHDRLGLLEAEVLPLLRGIAVGALDPGEPSVQQACAASAVALRQSLVDRALGTAGLLGELAPALRAARERGVPVEVQVVGDPGQPSPQVAAATLAAVEHVLRALPPSPVTLTVLAGEEVELFMMCSQLPRPAPEVTGLGRDVPAPARWRARVDAGSPACLEVRWCKAAA